MAAGDIEEAAHVTSVGLRFQAHRQHHHVHRNAPHGADERVFRADDQLALLRRAHRPVRHLGRAPANEVDILFQQLIVELLVAFARRAHVNVEVVDFRAGALFHQVRQLEGIHTTDARAVFIRGVVAAADTVDDAHRLRYAAVAQGDLAAGGAGSVHQALDFEAGIDAGVLAVAVFGDALGVKRLEAGGDDDGAYLDLGDLFLLVKINGVALASGLAALLALAGLEVDARCGVNEHHRRGGLREGHVDRLALRQAVVELVVEPALFEDAGFHAGVAAHAEVFFHVARLAAHLHAEVAHVAGHLRHFRVGPQRDVRVHPHQRHFRGEDAGRAVEGGEGLVELRHVAADGRLALHQVDLLAGVGQRQRRVDAGDAAAHHQHVRLHRHPLALQRLVPAHAGYRRGDQCPRLLGGGCFIRRHPTHVLADVGHLEKERVDAALRRRATEGSLVHQRRAGRHHDAVQPVLADILLDELLPGVGAHEFVIARHDDAGERCRELRHVRHVHFAGDVDAAMANIHPDADRVTLVRSKR
ncbi:MAG: hypothetical protein BWY76_01490 [bacterium ADurb.Bin429]|nr:MAG: hypothetical protein BWY76_01490 [bacterium ADurb.Bin429]